MTGRFLRASGLHADIEPDERVRGAYVLSIGGAEQSHVDLRDPTHVFYEYLRRIANVVDLAGPAGQPLRCLHLGAGALTLARYVQATRPGCDTHQLLVWPAAPTSREAAASTAIRLKRSACTLE